MTGKRAPDWPRLMTKTTLAMYLDITPAEVEKEVVAGRLPMPVRIGSRDHWSRTAVDASVDHISGERVNDWRAGQPLYAGR